MSLESFQLSATAQIKARQNKVLSVLRSLVLPDVIREATPLVFCGPLGTGKDHLAVAMMYRVIDQMLVECRWVNGLELFGLSRDGMSRDQPEEQLLRTYCDPVVLTISDPIPPKGDASAWNVGLLYRIIDRRYRACKPTWVTINCAGQEEMEERLSGQVFDRLKHGAYFLSCFWPSARQSKNSAPGANSGTNK